MLGERGGEWCITVYGTELRNSVRAALRAVTLAVRAHVLRFCASGH